MITSFDNNKDKVCLLLKDDVGGSYVRSRAKSHNPGSRNYNVILRARIGIFFKEIAKMIATV